MTALSVVPDGQGDDEFDLNEAIRFELANNPVADLRAVSLAVAKRVPAHEVERVLAGALYHQVRRFVTQERKGVRRIVPHDDDAAPGRTSRWVGVGQLYKRFLEQRENISGEEWKFLGDCTRADVAAIAAQRMEQAKANALVAKRYERLAAAMAHYDAATVADLPETVVIEVLR